MPNVAYLHSKYKQAHPGCDVCGKPMSVMVSPTRERPHDQANILPNQFFSDKVQGTFHFCDSCMSRNEHILFSAGIEAHKFYVTAMRRKKGQDLPPLHN